MPEAPIILIRHGQSQANAGAATDHPSTIELTELGHQQAAQLARQIQRCPDRVIVSPFVRTLQTAQPLLDQYAKQGQDIPVETWPIQEFTYLSPVRCRGTTVVDRQEWAKAYWQRSDPRWNDGDGAESFAQLISRVQAFSDRLNASTANRLVFGHGMFFKAFLIGLEAAGFEATPEAMQRYRALETAQPIRNAQMIALEKVSANTWRQLPQVASPLGAAS